MEKFKYDSSDIQVLEGLEAVKNVQDYLLDQPAQKDYIIWFGRL
jgi:DNA gyrase/topoisomerase IV subunit B